jgi:VanZ family protein
MAFSTDRRDASRRLVLAVAASLAVVLSAPFIGQLRGAIQEAFPDRYRLIILSLVALAVAGAVQWAVRSIRERHLTRYGLMATAFAVATIYALATATGNANVDAVERFHFVEYGLLAVLFHRAWGERERAATVVLPFMATFLVGTLDEAMQWFVPLRVGEWRDVALNSVAIGCGLMFGVAVRRAGSRTNVGWDAQRPASTTVPQSPGLLPPSPMLRRTAEALRGGGRSSGLHAVRDPALLIATLLALAVFATFVYVVHVGHEIRDPAIGVFRSRFTASELLQASADRAARWRTNPPIDVRRLSREDQYLAEAIWHVQRRNEAERPGGIWAQWKENLILEKYFSPVLDTPTYLTPEGARWPDEQRANAAAAAASDTRSFVSDAPPIPIYTPFSR